MSAHQLQVLDLPVDVDNRGQDNIALYSRRSRQGRVYRFFLVNQQALGHALRDAYALGCYRNEFRHIRKRTRGVDHASDHSSDLSAGNSSRYAAYDSSAYWHRRWRLFFLNHLNLLWNLGRRAQLTARKHIGLNLPNDFLHLRC